MRRWPAACRLLAGLALYGVMAGAAATIENAYLVHLLILSCIFAVLVMSQNLVTGYMGLLHLCQAAFYGIGAYASALVAMKLHVGVPLACLVGTGVAAGSGLVVGVLSIRFGGHYLAIVTLGFGVIVNQILNNWVGLTRGPMGLSGIPAPPAIRLLGLTIAWTPYTYLLGGLLLVFLTYLVLARIRDSKVGLMMEAIRENELAAACVGIPTVRVKVAAFTLAALLAGPAGAMYAHYSLMLVPELFGFFDSANLIAMAVLGGLGSFAGSIASAVFFTVVPEMLRVAGEWRLVIYGGLLVVVVLFFPKGLAGLGTLVREKIAGACGRRSSRPPIGEGEARGAP